MTFYFSVIEDKRYYICSMFLQKKSIILFYLPLAGMFLLLIMQSIWLYNSYQLAHKQFIADIEKAFKDAREKEQTYRIPISDIMDPGVVTIESCGSEEILIIRKCAASDTIVYDNLSGISLETFINQAFSELREHIVPLNIHCLADLFAGSLHDKDISLTFVIERFNKMNGQILENSTPLGAKQTTSKATYVFFSDISKSEAFRVILQFSPTIVLWQIRGILASTTCILIAILLCFGATLYSINPKSKQPEKSFSPATIQNENNTSTQNKIFQIGQYIFDSDKSELQYGDEIIQLNKKENAILSALCFRQGSMVERSFLLVENWGDNGVIYSRSLDTYITTLRKYLKQDSSIQIVTIKGVGYKLTVN